MLISDIDKKLHKMIIKENYLKLEVTAVYETTICGYCNEKFVTILSSGKKILPMSLVVLNDIFTKNIKQGTILTISNKEEADIFINDLTSIIDLKMKKTNDLKSALFKYEEILNFLKSQKVLVNSMLPITMNMFMPTSENMIGHNSNEMSKYIENQVNCIIDELEKNYIITANNIIGYGLGLTPSADDFLLGILSVFDHYNKIDKSLILRNYIEKYYHSTTEVSQWMLRYGCEFDLYPYIINMYFGMEINNDSYIENFLKHGSSSGLDLLCGILCGLKIIIEGDK